MNSTIKKIVAVTIVLGATVGSSALMGSAETTIDPITFNGVKISYPYTDDNTNENLLIYTDKQSYSDWDGSTIYFAVKNISGVVQNTDIQFLYAGNEGLAKIEEFAPHVGHDITVPDYASKQTCVQKMNLITNTPYDSCFYEQIGSHTETVYQDEWHSLTLKTAKALSLPANVTKEPAKFLPSKYVTYTIGIGETKYFRAKITYQPKKFSSSVQNEFYIKAKGDNGGVGILDPWYDNAWLYRIPITIDDAKVASTQTNFPVLIDITNASLAAGAQSDGDDIVFTSSDGTTKLSHEIELYTSATGRLTAHVKIPSLTGTGGGDTVIYMYYGNSGASNQQDVTGTWNSNYKAVWHFKDGTTLSMTDSTSNANTLTNTNSVAATTGQIDGAAGTFNGVDQGFFTATVPSTKTDDFAYSLWLKAGSTAGEQVFLSNGDVNTGVAIEIESSNWKFLINGIARVDSTVAADTTANHHLVITRVGGTSTFYVDGVAHGTSASTPNTPATMTTMGTQGTNTLPNYVRLSSATHVDEGRIIDTGLSANWITTEYNNQSATSTFYTIGTQEANAVSTPNSATVNVNGGVQVTGSMKI